MEKNDLNIAINKLNQGEVIAIPTDTVYGLVAHPAHPKAIEKIFKLKARPKTHPLILLLADPKDVKSWVGELPEKAKQLMDHFWPGPLTIILPTSLQKLQGHPFLGKTLGLRVPNHPLALKLLLKLGTGILSTSANLHKQPPGLNAEQVKKAFGGKLAFVLDGEETKQGQASTVIDFSTYSETGTATLLREGEISKQTIEQVLGEEIN